MENDKELIELIERTKKNLFPDNLYKPYDKVIGKEISYSELSMYDKSAGKKVIKAYVNDKKTYGFIFFLDINRKLNWTHGCFKDLDNKYISVS